MTFQQETELAIGLFYIFAVVGGYTGTQILLEKAVQRNIILARPLLSFVNFLPLILVISAWPAIYIYFIFFD